MTVFFIIFRFAAYFLLESMVVQFTHMLTTDHKIKSRAYTAVCIGVVSFILAYSLGTDLLDSLDDIRDSMPVLFMLAYLFLLFIRLFLYSLVFRKISLKLLYIYVLAISTDQIYRNFIDISEMSDETLLPQSLAFILEFIVLSVIMFSIKRKKKEDVYRQILSSLPKRLYLLVLMMLFTTSVVVMVAFFKHTYKYVITASMLILLVCIFFVIKIGLSEAEKKANIDLLSKQVENQIGYYEKINSIYGEFRSFRHDYNNHVLCLQSLISAGKNEEALEYMKTMQDMSSVGKNRYHTGNVIIDALLDDKSGKAEQADAVLEFEGTVPDEGISNADLCIIIANAVDNAIEACAKDETHSTKTIHLTADCKQGFFYFMATNPVFEEVKLKGKNKPVTSKTDKEHHGFGVANIVRTAEKYSGTAEISSDGGEFTIEVQLSLKPQ